MASDGPMLSETIARVEKEFLQARDRFQSETNNDEAAWLFARACFDVAELATNKTGRAEAAEQGIGVCRRLIARQPALAPAHYYLGMNLGQLADTKRNLAAFKMVKEMEHEFQEAAELDERFDYAGPDRNLGLLYLQAPAVVSIGSRTRARQHLKRAVELAPDYPENRLNLIEAGLKWGDFNTVRRETKAFEEFWPEARLRFAGETWAASRLDWENRLKIAKRKIEESAKSIQGPHHGD